MNSNRISTEVFTAAQLFDGSRFLTGQALVVRAGRIVALLPEQEAPPGERVALGGGVLAPGLVDLRACPAEGPLRAGDGLPRQLAQLCASLGRRGVTSALPLIGLAEGAALRSVLAAGVVAVGRVPGLAGLHLALSAASLTDDMIDTLCEARAGLPALMLTLPPGAASPAQTARLRGAGLLFAPPERPAPEGLPAQLAASAMAAALIDAPAGRLAPGWPADLVYLSEAGQPFRVWRRGVALA